MFVKNYVQSYKTNDWMVLKEETDFEVKILRVWFFGLFKTRKTIIQTLMPYSNWQSHFELWDELIKTQKPINI